MSICSGDKKYALLNDALLDDALSLIYIKSNIFSMGVLGTGGFTVIPG